MSKKYSVKQASEVFGFSEAYYRKLIFEKRIEFVKVGRAVRISGDAIEAYFKANGVVVGA